MEVSDAGAHFAALARLGVPAEGVHVGGGEPFGDFPRLLAIVRAAREAGPGGVGYVETSGVWATDDTLARDRLDALAKAGMRQISLSADPYHQEFIPPDRIRRLTAVAREVLGEGGVRARRWRWIQNPEDVAALSETDRRDLFRRFLQRYPERMTGRAAKALAPLVPRVAMEAVPEVPCKSPLLSDRHVHVDPEGWVYPGTCAGLTLGRVTREHPLDEMLAAWRPEAAPITTCLAQAGPRHLARWAADRGFEPDPDGYAGPCHLCWNVRAFLARTGGGGELRPVDLYAEIAP